MSLLDILHNKHEDVFNGQIWKDLPFLEGGGWISTTENPQFFDYEVVNERDSNYANLLNTLEAPETLMTIKTSDKVEVDINYYITTQDGALWQVKGVVTKYYEEKSKQTLRFLRQAIDEAKIMRLIKIENPYGI